MANSMRNDMRPQPVPEDEVAVAEHDTTLNLGHAGLASECWTGGRGAGSGTTRSNMMPAPRAAALCLRRPVRPRGRQRPRPSQPAEARFAAADGQFLTE